MTSNLIHSNKNLNTRLLLNLGAHIGHAKIDWNVDSNAYLAGLTNNNYIIFNINKTLFFIKRSLSFMKSLGWNGGKFVIYEPGSSKFHNTLIEATLDKEGLLPTNYPFIHSIVKPGFFSNWRANYRKFLKRFYKIIFWNPFFFGAVGDKFFFDKVNSSTLKNVTLSDKLILNNSRLNKSNNLSNFVRDVKIYKKMRKPRLKLFHGNLKVPNSIIGKYDSNRNSSKNESYSFMEEGSDVLSFYDKYNTLLSNIFSNPSHNNTYNVLQDQQFSSFKLNKKKSLNRILISFRDTFKKLDFSVYKGYSNTNQRSILICNMKIKNNHLAFPYMSIIKYLLTLKSNYKAMYCYNKLVGLKGKDFVREIMKKDPTLDLGRFTKYLIKENLSKRRCDDKSENTLSLYSETTKKKSNQCYIRGIKNKFFFSAGETSSDSKNILKSKHSFKIKPYQNQAAVKKMFDNYKIRSQYIKKNSKIELLKMLYYNIYEVLVQTAIRKIKYKDNTNNLSIYEQRLFKRFIRFVLIFRYLKRISRIPSAVILLNPHCHESQITDFQSVNTSVVSITDSNSAFGSLSYFIPSNDDNIVLLLYYVKILSHAYSEGRKTSIASLLIPKFKNNLSISYDYNLPYSLQYKGGLKQKSGSYFLPFGSLLDKQHIRRLQKK